jgi:outer membrane protein TolC
MRKIVVLYLSVLSLLALDINEAIDRAMQNNPSLKEKELLFKASQKETDLARSGFKPTLDLSYNYSKFSKKSFVGANSSSSADATLGYNLFNGFSDKYGLKSSEEDQKAAQFTHDAAKADLRLQVYLAYIDYLRSKQQITVSQDTIRLLQQQLTDAKNFYEQGLFAKNDYLQVDVELSAAEQALLSSQRNVKIAFYKLKRLLGSALSKDEVIEDISRTQKELLLPKLKAAMLENRSELKVLNAQKRGLHYSYEAAASNYYPKVDVEAKYQVAGEDPVPNGGVTFQIHDQSTVGINLSWNLYEGGADEAQRASLLYQESAGNERLNSLYLELDFQLEQAVESYELARNQIKVAEKALEQATENFRITKDQYDANIANTSLMLDAQRFLARAQVNRYEAYFALYDAMGEIERVTEEEVF